MKTIRNSEGPAPIEIHARNLPEGTTELVIDRLPEILDNPAFVGELHFEGVLVKESERIHLDGTASVLGSFECTRCTEPVSRLITTPIHLEFVSPRLERDPEDENVHVYDPQQSPRIDITSDLRDALILAIPMTLLCRPDCKGLCPSCGVNRNRTECGCHEDGRERLDWMALNALRVRLRAEEEQTGHQS